MTSFFAGAAIETMMMIVMTMMMIVMTMIASVEIFDRVALEIRLPAVCVCVCHWVDIRR